MAVRQPLALHLQMTPLGRQYPGSLMGTVDASIDINKPDTGVPDTGTDGTTKPDASDGAVGDATSDASDGGLEASEAVARSKASRDRC